MAKSYLEIIGEYYPTASVHVIAGNDPDLYTNLVWSSTQITQAELDYVKLINLKTEKIILFSEIARDEVVDGFDSSALGFLHFYDSEPEDQLNLIGAVTTAGSMYYSCREYVRGYQIVDIGGVAVGTTATGLLNDATSYSASIEIDGVGVSVSVAGQNAQTVDALVTALNTDAGFLAVGIAELVSGNIKISSLTYSSTSTVNIVDTNLFTSLTPYVGLLTAMVGIDGGANVKEYKLHTHADLLQILNDGKDVKLTILQKFNTKRAEVEVAPDTASVDAIVW